MFIFWWHLFLSNRFETWLEEHTLKYMMVSKNSQLLHWYVDRSITQIKKMEMIKIMLEFMSFWKNEIIFAVILWTFTNDFDGYIYCKRSEDFKKWFCFQVRNLLSKIMKICVSWKWLLRILFSLSYFWKVRSRSYIFLSFPFLQWSHP